MDQKTTHRPNLMDQKTTQRPNLMDQKTTHRPNLMDQKTTHRPNLMDQKTTHRPNLMDQKTTHRPNLMDQKTTHRPNLMDQKTTHRPNLMDQKTTQRPNLMDQKTTHRPNLMDQKTTHCPNLMDQKTTHRPNLMDQKTTHRPNPASTTSAKHSGRPTLRVSSPDTQLCIPCAYQCGEVRVPRARDYLLWTPVARAVPWPRQYRADAVMVNENCAFALREPSPPLATPTRHAPLHEDTMKQPYFQERSLLPRVEKYMDDNQHVDLEELTEYLINNFREFRTKNKKAFMKSVEKAYEWQLYCLQQDDDYSCEEIEDSDGGGPDIMEIPEPRRKTTNAMVTKMYKLASPVPASKAKKNADPFFMDTEGTSSMNGTRTPDASARKKRKKEKDRDGDIEELIKRKKKKQLTPEVSTVTLSDMAGVEALEEKICDLAGNLRWPGVLQPLVKSALVTGPTGSGKTTFGQALAGTCEAPVLRVTATELVGGVSGESEERITEVFEQAAALSPCVLLLEKLEVVAPKDSTTTKGMERRICTQLSSCLANLKSKHKDKQVLVLGETTHPEKLDWDLRGSFDMEVFMAIPTEDARCKMLQLLCGGCVVAASFEDIAYRTPGYVAGDLKKLMEKAQSLAWKRKKVSLRGDHEGGRLEDRVKDFLGHLGRMCEAEEQKVKVTITMDDFMEALLHITPALKREGFPTVPDVTWQDIGGLQNIKTELREKILEPIKFAKLHEELKLSRPNGVLMWGPPGCGKTLLAKAVANEAGVNLLPVMGPELLNMYQGESERAVREVFHRARNVAPCVIFFDEFDSLCPVRSKGEQGGSKTTIVNTLLTEMNGFAKREDVYVIAATNRPDILDPAVTRPGRFDTLLYVDVPDHEGRVSIFRAITRSGAGPPLAPDVNLEELSQHCNNFSGADCDQLVYLAGKELIREVIHSPASDPASAPDPASASDPASEVTPGTKLVARRHFSAALKKIKPSISVEEQRRYKRLDSKMEAGRVQNNLKGFPEDVSPLVVPPENALPLVDPPRASEDVPPVADTPQDDAQPMDVADDKDNTTD
ncbi:Nuclear valosin-containing protein-like [Chionoecetes opilio]|uniref:Nuclear valosin-containing protein-like n=1 Tax=Chionoecetes opilio TaxID=41210 RepID=A0A8J5CLC8_CHIOP|nr:Nuclear valosin-containing protein-like [Chionoecetes opilio]